MERDAIAFAVDDDRAKPEGADRVLRFDDAAAVRRDCADRLLKPAAGVQIDHNSVFGGFFSLARQQAAPDLAVVVRQNTDRHTGKIMSFHFATENGGIKPYRAFQILHRDITPYNLIGHLTPLSVNDSEKALLTQAGQFFLSELRPFTKP